VHVVDRAVEGQDRRGVTRYRDPDIVIRPANQRPEELSTVKPGPPRTNRYRRQDALFWRISDGLGKRSACLVAWCCGRGRSPERSCGQGCEPGKAGDDAGALDQAAEVDEPGRLAEARTGQGHGREHGHGGACAVKTEAVLAGLPGPPATGECGGGQAGEHRDCGQIVFNTGTGGVGECIGRSWRVTADRVRGEDRRADKPSPCGADQGRFCLTAGSPARARPAAPARNNVPVTAKFPAWIQPRGPSARELTGWRSGR
jgi:hypothetical protein